MATATIERHPTIPSRFPTGLVVGVTAILLLAIAAYGLGSSRAGARER